LLQNNLEIAYRKEVINHAQRKQGVNELAKPFILPRSLPEAQGISSNAITEFINSIKAHSLELHSFMLLRHGHIVAEGWWSPYEAKLPHMLFSLSKSFTSTAIGLAVAEGILTLDVRLSPFSRMTSQ
jgi:hypothetical protein